LKYITKFEVVTARDALEYDEGQDIAVARGKARALHEKTPADKRQIEADVLTATFAAGPDGKKEMSRLYADGNVTVITKTDVSRGDHAVYDAKQNNAVLTGHVKITHGTSQLAGDAAKTDFTTGQSRILKDENSRRARAVVPPQPKKEDTDESADNP
jgi:lipopolysaccharide export system protein LptA